MSERKPMKQPSSLSSQLFSCTQTRSFPEELTIVLTKEVSENGGKSYLGISV